MTAQEAASIAKSAVVKLEAIPQCKYVAIEDKIREATDALIVVIEFLSGQPSDENIGA